MDDISDFEKRISSSMDRILKVIEKSEIKKVSVDDQSDEVSHLEKIISNLENEKEMISVNLQSALDEAASLKTSIETLTSSMENERLEYSKQREELGLENNRIKSQIGSFQTFRKNQVDEINSILADLEPLLENTGETNA